MDSEYVDDVVVVTTIVWQFYTTGKIDGRDIGNLVRITIKYAELVIDQIPFGQLRDQLQEWYDSYFGEGEPTGAAREAAEADLTKILIGYTAA